MENKLYDSGVLIGYISPKVVKKQLKIGFIKKVKGSKNTYQTNMDYLIIPNHPNSSLLNCALGKNNQKPLL